MKKKKGFGNSLENTTPLFCNSSDVNSIEVLLGDIFQSDITLKNFFGLVGFCGKGLSCYSHNYCKQCISCARELEVHSLALVGGAA